LFAQFFGELLFEGHFGEPGGSESEKDDDDFFWTGHG